MKEELKSFSVTSAEYASIIERHGGFREVSKVYPDVSFLGPDRGHEWDLDSIYEGLGISKYLQPDKEATQA